MSDEKCITCRHYRRTILGYEGRCRRNPGPEGTPADFWCDEWERAEHEMCPLCGRRLDDGKGACE